MSTLKQAIEQRGIVEVVHFTTNEGLVGILASCALKSRKRLPQEKYLEFVYSPNCAVRYDVAWLDYVNLSITRINAYLWDISSNKWHRNRDIWWCVLAFDPAILLHDGVLFATTNNKYDCCKREKGLKGFEALFAPRVQQFPDKWPQRWSGLPANRTTCPDAEVLYPGEVEVQHLKRIYVATQEHLDIVHAQCDTLGAAGIDVVLAPEAFK